MFKLHASFTVCLCMRFSVWDLYFLRENMNADQKKNWKTAWKRELVRVEFSTSNFVALKVVTGKLLEDSNHACAGAALTAYNKKRADFKKANKGTKELIVTTKENKLLQYCSRVIQPQQCKTNCWAYTSRRRKHLSAAP